MWPVCPSYFLHTDKLQISCLLGKVQGQSWSSWRYSGSLLVAPAGNKWNHNNCAWFIICTGQPLHVSSVKYLIKGAGSRRCCLSRDPTLQILVAATCYLTSCCLSMVSNESAHYDLWPLTSKKAFSITSLQFTSYFLLLGRFSVTSRGGCDVVKIQPAVRDSETDCLGFKNSNELYKLRQREVLQWQILCLTRC